MPEPPPAALPFEKVPAVVFEFQDEEIAESSGLAVASYDPGLVFTHNDSSDGEPARLFAVGGDGRTRATYPLARVECEDCEDLARVGRTIWLADIGNNWRRRAEVALYRFPEPRGASRPITTWARYRFRYADGRHDAEGLLVQPGTGRVFLVTKELLGTSAVYAGPARLDPDRANVLTRVTSLPLLPTGAAFSPTGDRLVIRGYGEALLWRVPHGDVVSALRTAPQRLALPEQRQGEAVTFTADGRALLLSSEGLNQPVWRVPLPPDGTERAVPARPDDLPQVPPAAPWLFATLGVALVAVVGWAMTRSSRGPRRRRLTAEALSRPRSPR